MTSRLELAVEQWIKIGIILFISSFIWSPSRDGLDGAYVLFFLLPMIFLVVRKRIVVSISDDLLIKLILFFCLYSAISSLWNTPEDIGFFALQALALITWIVGTFWLVSNNKIVIRHVFLALMYIGCAVSLITIIAFYGLGYEDTHLFNTRLTCWCSAKNPNLIGGVYGVLTLISYAYLLSSPTHSERIKFGLISLLLVLPLILSQSRGAILGFLISSLVTLVIMRPKAWLIFLQFIIALPGLGLFILINYSALQTLWLERTTSMGQRNIIWHFVFERLPENFLTGIGLSQNTKIFIEKVDNFNHAHSAWLDTFFRTGVIGFTLIALITFILMKKAISLTSIEGKIFFVWFLFGLVALTFDHRILFWQIDTKWFFYWVPAPFIMALQMNQKKIKQALT